MHWLRTLHCSLSGKLHQHTASPRTKLDRGRRRTEQTAIPSSKATVCKKGNRKNRTPKPTKTIASQNKQTKKLTLIGISNDLDTDCPYNVCFRPVSSFMNPVFFQSLEKYQKQFKSHNTTQMRP
jgi:hypothetical protein